jgi:hypothetical protein
MCQERGEDALLHLTIPALSAPAASATASRFWHTCSYTELTVSARAHYRRARTVCASTPPGTIAPSGSAAPMQPDR